MIEFKRIIGRWTNTGQWSAIYSQDKNWFVRSRINKDFGEYQYTWYLSNDEKYLLFDGSVWNKQTPKYKIVLATVSLENENVVTNPYFTLEFDEGKDLKLELPVKLPKPLIDFFVARPAYHSKIEKWLFEEKYNVDDTSALLALKGKCVILNPQVYYEENL